MGLNDIYPRSGHADKLLDAYGLSVDSIVENAKKAMNIKLLKCSMILGLAFKAALR